MTSINAELVQAVGTKTSPPHVKQAMHTSATAKGKAYEAADKLASVKIALKNAVRERQQLEIQLSAVTEREDGLRHASVHDPLTGLPNRALSNDRLEHALAQAKRHHRSLAVMFIDLDGFKKINDNYGHDAGDQVLKIIATRLADGTRSDDTLSRHGGDEFLYVLTDYKSEHDLAAIAEKLHLLIQAPCEIHLNNETTETFVSASIGIAIFPKHGDIPEALIKSADSAMYSAKRSGFSYAFAA